MSCGWPAGRGQGEAASPPAPGRPRRRKGTGSDTGRGAVTAEFAVALPAVLLLLALLLAGSAAGVTQLRLEEAARARGEDAAAVDMIVRQLAGASAASAVASDGGWLSVTVSGKVPGAVGSLLPWTLTARAWTRGETSGPTAAARVPPAWRDQLQKLAA